MRKSNAAEKRFRSRYSNAHRLIALAIMLGMSSFILAIPAMARNTYVINDGHQVIVHSTYTEDTNEVLTEAGLELDDSDTYTTVQTGNSHEITIQRNQTIWVNADGKTYQTQTYGATVEEILAQIGVKLGAADWLSAQLDRTTYDGMYLRVARITQETVTTDEVIAASDTVYQNNVLQPGQETVLTEGSDGLDRVSYNVTYRDGVEVSRVESGRETVTPAYNRVVIRGAESAAMPVQGEANTIITAGGEELKYSRAINGKATAYNCPGYVGHTASGTIAQVGKVAVDPKVIPLGTKLYVVSQDGQYVYGYCVAEDTGGLIKGNKVDLYFSTWDECIQFGYRPVTIYVVDEG